MCSPYGMIASTNPSGNPLPDWSPPPKPGGAPPPDKVNDQEVESQTDRQTLADQAQADVSDWPEKPINWRTRRPSKDEPFEIRFARLQSGGPKKGKPGNWEYIDPDRHSLKLNPDGSAALGHGRDYYENLDNWYSKAEWDSFYGDDSTANNLGNDDGVNL